MLDPTVGDSVMTIDHLKNSKLMPRYEGPYTVVEKTKGGSFKLLDKDQSLLKRAYTTSQLKLISKKRFSEEKTIENVTKSYVVEKIVKHRGKEDDLQYLVKWKNYPASQNTWESYDNFDDVNIIRTYWKNLKKKK